MRNRIRDAAQTVSAGRNNRNAKDVREGCVVGVAAVSSSSPSLH
jgi:hypothetical protein